MDVTKLLEADHREVEDLFSQIEEADGSERRSLVERLVTSLRSHMELEEAVLYPTMQPVTGEEPVEEAIAEHGLARKGMQDLVNLAPDEPGFDGALESLKAGIEHHVEEEENEIFPKLRKEGTSVLDQITDPFLNKRAELGLPTDAAALASSASKDELLEEATQAEIEGASSMTKQELAEALLSRRAS